MERRRSTSQPSPVLRGTAGCGAQSGRISGAHQITPSLTEERDRNRARAPTNHRCQEAAARLLSGLGSADPPKGTNLARILKAAYHLKQSGKVDVVDINSNPVARVMMDLLVTAGQIEEQVGIPTIPHVTTREMNIMGLQSLMLGAWGALKIRNVLAVTGDSAAGWHTSKPRGYTKSTPSAWSSCCRISIGGWIGLVNRWARQCILPSVWRSILLPRIWTGRSNAFRRRSTPGRTLS